MLKQRRSGEFQGSSRRGNVRTTHIGFLLCIHTQRLPDQLYQLWRPRHLGKTFFEQRQMSRR